MRIIAGKYRRRLLEVNSGMTTRPITDRVKVALFDKIERELQGVRIADIFSGTGSMGLESLSRGGVKCVFIEADHKAYSLLRKNVESLGIEEDVVCWKTDVVRCSFKPKGVTGFSPFDVIFFDPPYAMTHRLQPGVPLFKSLERLAGETISSPGSLLILRADCASEFTMPDCWGLEERREFGRNAVHFYRKAPSSNESLPLDEDRLDTPGEGKPLEG